MSAIIADTSEWIEYFGGRPAPALEAALATGAVWLPPLVVAELVSGVRSAADRTALLDLLDDLPVHDATREHWVRVGDFRRSLRAKGLSVSAPDAHVAVCALDREAILLTRDAVFRKMAKLTALQVG